MDGFCTCFPEPRAVVFEEPAKDTVFEEQITVRSETARVAMPAAVAVAPEDNELKQSDIEDESLDLEEGRGERSASRIRSVVPLASDGTAEQALYEYWGYDIECIGAYTVMRLSWNLNGSALGTFGPRCASILAGFVTFAQIVIPISLFGYQYARYDLGACPDLAVPVNPAKLIMCAIACVYTSRTMTQFIKKAKLSANNSVMKTRGHRSALARRTGFAGLGVLHIKYMIYDDFMNTFYVSMVYLLNLWLVFTTDEPIEMVLNSLAMEFLMNIDSEFTKTFRQHLYGKELVEYVISNELHSKPATQCQISIGRAVSLVAYSVSALTPIICLIMVIYGPVCK